MILKMVYKLLSISLIEPFKLIATGTLLPLKVNLIWIGVGCRLPPRSLIEYAPYKRIVISEAHMIDWSSDELLLFFFGESGECFGGSNFFFEFRIGVGGHRLQFFYLRELIILMLNDVLRTCGLTCLMEILWLNYINASTHFIFTWHSAEVCPYIIII